MLSIYLIYLILYLGIYLASTKSVCCRVNSTDSGHAISIAKYIGAGVSFQNIQILMNVICILIYWLFPIMFDQYIDFFLLEPALGKFR